MNQAYRVIIEAVVTGESTEEAEQKAEVLARALNNQFAAFAKLESVEEIPE